MKLVTAEIMRELDRKTIEEIGIPGMVLMENAGVGATKMICRYFAEPLGQGVVIFAGSGNNGGDGFVIARHLINRGVPVKVYLLTDKGKVKGDAKTNLNILTNMGIEVYSLTDLDELKAQWAVVERSGVIIDAILGTGLQSEVKGFYREVIELINRSGKPVVAVDTPSGLDNDRGRPLGAAIKADLTLTFGLPKLGQVIYPGADYVGKLEIIDISIPQDLINNEGIKNNLLESQDFVGFFPARDSSSHKGDYGHLLVLAGSPGKTGAAAMTSMAAMRVGTGLVTVGVPESLNSVMEVKLTEVMTEPLPESNKGYFGLKALPPIKDLLRGKNALALGPGISTTEEVKGFMEEIILTCEVPLVVDADGINCLADRVELIKKRKAPLILTPHPGEMARLAECSVKEVQEDRVGVSREFAKKLNIYLVLKGARTIVAEPSGAIYINPSGNPGMASGGTGDVLTGMIGGFLAQGSDPVEAAKAGVFFHGLAGDEVVKDKGISGMIASDLIETLPRIIKQFEKS
ncbi:MAG: NAD(P)H-hydrate dehydratase [Deltaproteobacteria bacterium]|nr:MAG: NAD(P)H-hydrate dehydratase [Deltaproteobacteria bacterium]